MTDTKEKPPLYFSIGEVAKIFGKSVHWVRWRERAGHFKLPDGGAIEPTRDASSETSKRQYTIEDIEDMSFSLLRRGAISYSENQRVKKLIDNYPKPKSKKEKK